MQNKNVEDYSKKRGKEMNEQIKNKARLESFVTYCNEHPKERFWQALRNWSEYNFIYGSETLYIRDEAGDHVPKLEDTFYKE